MGHQQSYLKRSRLMTCGYDIAFFGVTGSRNDINVLYESPIFNNVLQGNMPEINFIVNDTTYTKRYYLTDGIYPEWTTFVKAFPCPEDPKRKLFKERQESTRKDVERAFGMKKSQTIDAFFKRKNDEIRASQSNITTNIDHLNFESRLAKSLGVEINKRFDIQSLERDLGLRPHIWEYPIEKRDEVRRAYIKAGPYQYKADATFCLPCYLFHTQDRPSRLDAFTINEFHSWKKVRDGKNCAFLAHIGKDLTSPHRNAEKACEDLMNQQIHIVQSFEKFTSQEVAENRLRFKASIEVTRWLVFQGCSFRGHDESIISNNRENFLELLSFIVSYNDKVEEVLNKAPRNASYTSSTTQKQILQVLDAKVKNVIREEIGDAKFCIMVDEAQDESKKEQMSIVLRFVDKDGYVQKRFFGVVHVKDTIASTLKEFAASKEVIPVHHLFIKLSSIINVVSASSKRNDQLKVTHASNIAHLLNINELESGKGLNQIGSLQRAGDTRWSSHLKSISSLIKMLSATCEVLLNIIDDGTTPAQRGDADAAYKSQDILNAMHLVSSTKLLIQKLRDDGWDELVADVKSFCQTLSIPIPDFNAQYIARRGRARHQQDEITIDHHYRVDIFNVVIDSQLQELNIIFNDNTVELIILSSALDPREMHISFRIDDICRLVQKFYPKDFTNMRCYN
ncbi:uncharacterized protein LOC122002799 [Zingiber officinale]|uniref:uncharacterized protein LOC122002799 n=1 Tax=Zingiber officinale TaxID=94328 RepID=UPI001C4DBD2B|nr:uncharacterized protein LOC122002799 [Zingiber officinale]